MAYGRMKAAVFPDPVWAHAIKSRFSMAAGIATFWMGVGFK
jgi:hypothetical protein